MAAADPNEYRLSEQELDQRFESRVRRFVFEGCRPSSAPTLVLLGGQPAAGKSSAVAAISQRHGNLVPLTGDELRQFHPAFTRLLHEDPLRMPSATAQASGQWVKLSIDHAVRYRYGLMLEGVFRDPSMVADTAERFAGAGYRVEVVGLAVPEARSPSPADAGMNRHSGPCTPEQGTDT